MRDAIAAGEAPEAIRQRCQATAPENAARCEAVLGNQALPQIGASLRALSSDSPLGIAFETQDRCGLGGQLKIHQMTEALGLERRVGWVGARAVLPKTYASQPVPVVAPVEPEQPEWKVEAPKLEPEIKVVEAPKPVAPPSPAAVRPKPVAPAKPRVQVAVVPPPPPPPRIEIAPVAAPEPSPLGELDALYPRQPASIAAPAPEPAFAWGTLAAGFLGGLMAAALVLRFVRGRSTVQAPTSMKTTRVRLPDGTYL
jgi:hypothetical protein